MDGISRGTRCVEATSLTRFGNWLIRRSGVQMRNLGTHELRPVSDQDLVDVVSGHSQVLAIFRIKNVSALAENLGQSILTAPCEGTWITHPARMVKIHIPA